MINKTILVFFKERIIEIYGCVKLNEQKPPKVSWLLNILFSYEVQNTLAL